MDADGKYTSGTYSENVTKDFCAPGYAAFANGTDPETYTIAEAYSVFYNSNTNEPVKDTAYVQKSNPVHTVLDNTFSWGSIGFANWNTKADGTGAPYAAGALMTLSSDTTLYAQWNIVATIGATPYGTLQDAVTAAQDGDVINVVANINPSEVQEITISKSLTITAANPDTYTYTVTDHHLKISGTSVELTVSNLNFAGNSWINANNGRALTVDHVNATVAPSNEPIRWQKPFIALGGSEFATGLALTLTNSTIVSTNATGEDPACQGWAYISEATIAGNTFGSPSYPYPFTAVKLMNTTDGAQVVIENNTVYGQQGTDSPDSKFYAFDLYRNNSRANSYNVTSNNNKAYNQGTNNNFFFLYRIECNTLNRTLGNLEVTDNGSQIDDVPVVLDGITYEMGDNYTDVTLYGVGVVRNGSNEITEGTFNVNSEMLRSQCADTYMPVENDDHTWRVVTVYFVNFNANGGDGGTMENYYVDRTENTISVPECAFTHDSPAQVFVGWNTAANGTGTPYTPGDNVTLTNDITFYAQWSDFHYIAYHSNDGNDFTRYQLKPDDHSVALEDGTAFARPGQNVSAWNTQADGNGTTYALGSDFPAGINNSPDLYAVWTASPYPIEEVAENISHVGFVVAGNGDFSVGQLFAIPVVVTEASSAPGVQQAYVVTADYEGDRCEGYAYNEYGFSVDATAPAENMYLTNYDPDVRNFFGYDSITHLTLNIHLTQQTKDTVIFLADYDDPRFGTSSGDQEVTYSTAEFGCDSVVTLRIYRLGSIADETRTANPGQYEVEVEMAAIPEIVPADFFTAGGTLTPASTAPYVNNYPTGTTTPVVWIATIADSSASFTNYVIINEPDCESLHPEDGSGNTYDVVRLIHDCWLKTNLRAEQYADHTDIPDVHHYPGADPAIYGYLYTYDAATGHYPLRDPDTLQGACPTGWHIPSYEKVAELMQYYESEDLMSQTNWLNPGTDISGFTMQPGGYYTAAGSVHYQDLLVRAYFWTYTPGGSIYHACEFGSACGTMELIPALETMGYSVRCIKD